MKILFFINGIYLGGKERRLVELMKELKCRKNFEFELVVMNSEINYNEIFDLKVNIHFLIRKKQKDFSIFGRFYAICKNYKPDIVHCWDGMTALYSIPACRLLKIKLINGMITDSPRKRNILKKKWLKAKLSFPFSDAIVANSESGLKAYKTPNKKGCVIHNGYNFDRNKNLTDIKDIRKQFDISTRFIIGMIATFSKFKDYNTYYKAAEIILQKRNDVTFLAVGNNTDSTESYDLLNPPLKHRYRLLGKQSDIESIVNALDIGVLSTFTEGISNSILEYLSFAKPVVATEGSGTNEIMKNNETGFLVKVSDAVDMAEKIQLLLDNPVLCKNMGAIGQKRVRNSFSMEAMTNKYVHLYNDILNGGRGEENHGCPESENISKLRNTNFNLI